MNSRSFSLPRAAAASRPDDVRWMVRALVLAERGRPHAHPNPAVGAVVARAGRCVGEGAHERFGGPHAEVNALAQAGRRARGATLYVTLEPCHRFGKTPPCCDAILRAGVRRVVVAASDASVRGAGLARLRARGVRVDAGVLEGPARDLNPGFHARLEKKRPHVILKIAQTLDGKIATAAGRSRWITGTDARRLGHRLRAQSDALLVGAGTVRRDDPFLGAHGQGPDPIRVVLSSSLAFRSTSRVFRPEGLCWVLTRDDAPRARRERLAARGVAVIGVPGGAPGRVDLRRGVSALARRGVGRLMVEGGGATAAAFLEAGLVDEVYCFVAPGFLGGADAPTSVEGRGVPAPAALRRLARVNVTRVGTDLLLHGVY
jgi:diaminohydroxyphosphoribosylaminopyrimidine deaminase/5-amino-6-(5-phosphoribosylamino)uracil reductase